MKLLRLLISLAAVIFAVVLGLRIPTDWYGEVYTNGSSAVERATVLHVRQSRVQGSVFTMSDGKFSINAGARDSTERLVICKRGFEPATVEQRPRRRHKGSSNQGSVVQLVIDNPNFEPPFIAPIRTVLPSECR